MSLVGSGRGKAGGEGKEKSQLKVSKAEREWESLCMSMCVRVCILSSDCTKKNTWGFCCFPWCKFGSIIYPPNHSKYTMPWCRFMSELDDYKFIQTMPGNRLHSYRVFLEDLWFRSLVWCMKNEECEKIFPPRIKTLTVAAFMFFLSCKSFAH